MALEIHTTNREKQNVTVQVRPEEKEEKETIHQDGQQEGEFQESHGHQLNDLLLTSSQKEEM